MDYTKFKHISFDLWLTLIRSNPDFKIKRSRLLADFFELQDDIDTIHNTIKKFDKVFNRIAEISGEHIEQSKMWLIILHDLGCNIDKVRKEDLERFNKLAEELFFQYSPVLIDENSETIFSNITAKGISINILSNTGFIRGHALRKLLSNWGIDRYLDFQVYSDETGYFKPGPKAFEEVFNAVQKIKPVMKSDILHIGDNTIADVEGATQFGLSAAYLAPDEKISTLITH